MKNGGMKMALINCSECGKEISDKSKTCIHCGNPLETHGNEGKSAQKVEVTGLDIKGKGLKKTIISIVIILFVVVGSVYVYSLVQGQAEEANLTKDKNNYIQLVEEARAEMFLGAYNSEMVSNLIGDIWYNTIYEVSDYSTDKYTKVNGVFRDDFNSSMAEYFSTDSYIDSIDSIESSKASTNELMRDLQEPPQGLENLYNTVTDLHESYLKVCQNAINPRGNLTSYTASVNENTSEFVTIYNRLESQIPNIEESN